MSFVDSCFDLMSPRLNLRTSGQGGQPAGGHAIRALVLSLVFRTRCLFRPLASVSHPLSLIPNRIVAFRWLLAFTWLLQLSGNTCLPTSLVQAASRRKVCGCSRSYCTLSRRIGSPLQGGSILSGSVAFRLGRPELYCRTPLRYCDRPPPVLLVPGCLSSPAGSIHCRKMSLGCRRIQTARQAGTVRAFGQVQNPEIYGGHRAGAAGLVPVNSDECIVSTVYFQFIEKYAGVGGISQVRLRGG